MSLEGRFYCIEGVLSSECLLKTGLTLSEFLEDRFNCMEGVLIGVSHEDRASPDG